MAAQLSSTSLQEQDAPPVPYGRALIASDASRAADGALRIGAALAARDQAVLSLISVVEPMPYPMPVNDLALSPSAHQSADEAVIKARRHDLDMQAERTGTPLPDDVLVECSVPLSGILFHATARKADLIILGLGRHRAVDRIFGTETALHAVREADVATLAVPGAMESLPRHALVGIDFDASSVAAARGAARLVGPHGTLTLVHVDPLAEPLPAMLADWPPHVLDRINEAFTRTVSALSLPSTMRVDMVTLAGNVAKELIAHADKVQADVIAIGRHSRSLVERMVLGSSTTRVVRTAHCAVMVIPRES